MHKYSEKKEQQRIAVMDPKMGRNSFLVARWRPPQAAACRVRRRPSPLLLLLLLLVLLYS